ncbi:SCO1860 family LAETG-anchored protein [Streptomyces sp. NPDC090306]|uniref:SCO1860 family LAETG-anchored protein n=1 Tax=Streptomyces sp. NPDC090306 TaxID=3365961 RepID=UPI00382E6D83
MNRNKFRMPARRVATAAAATVLAAGPATLAGAGTAHATGDHGRASAVVLRTGLDVSLLDKSVEVPLSVSLNDVQAPRSADKSALTADVDGVEGGRPVSVLSADVATAKATASKDLAEGSTHLARARLHVPGLPLLSLVELQEVTSRATCAAGERPEAESNVLGPVTVLGKRVTLSAGGTTDVKVPGVGEVRLDLSQKRTTSSTAAATALELTVSVNPLKLNVADVEGTLTLAEATCRRPSGGGPREGQGSPASAEPDDRSGSASPAPASDVKAQGAPAEKTANLAETGGSSATPYIAGGAVALLAAGGGAVLVARRRG